MARLPQDVDYGQRPSLQSNRLDRPGTGSQESAAALTSAATMFAQVLEEKQGKEDKLNYALARNDLIEADLLEREKLAEDQDWKTQGERYTSGFNTAREAISSSYDLSPNDRAILNSEGDLIGARGGVAVRARSRQIEVDQGYTKLLEGTEAARENLLRAQDFATRNKVIEGQLEAIEAARAEGYIESDEAAEIMRQKLTQDFATASILAMSDEDQIEILEGTLANRKGYTEGNTSGVGPVSSDDVRAGKGSGNVGDFLHADTAAKMLQSALGRDKENRQTIEAQEIFNQARSIFPEDPVAVLKYVQDNSEGSVEEKAARMARQLRIDENNANVLLQRELSKQYSDQIRDDPNFTYEMIPAADKEAMEESTKRDLIAFEDSLAAQRGGFAKSTVWSTTDVGGKAVEGNSWAKWNDMSNEEKKSQVLDSAEWKSVLTEGVWLKLHEEQQELLKPTKKINPENIMTNDQIFTSLMAGGINGSGGLLPRTGRSIEEDEIWNRELFRFRDRVGQASANEYGGGEVPYLERKKIMLQMMSEQAWVRDASDFDSLEAKGFYWFGDDLDKEDALAAMAMSDKMREGGFVYYDTFQNLTTTMTIGEGNEAVNKEVTWPEWFKNEAANKLDGYVPTQKDMENAMFAEQQNMGYAEMLRRLGGGGEK